MGILPLRSLSLSRSLPPSLFLPPSLLVIAVFKPALLFRLSHARFLSFFVKFALHFLFFALSPHPYRKVRELVGPEGQVIGAVSGGVDSSVAAVLLQKAIGDRFHAVLVDNGLLRKNEAVEVVSRLKVREGRASGWMYVSSNSS